MIQESDFTRATDTNKGDRVYILPTHKLNKDYETALKYANIVGGEKRYSQNLGSGIVFYNIDVKRKTKEINSIIFGITE